jgi:hypothetical protein
MDEIRFIVTAYSLAGILVASLCIATWLRARRINARLNEKNNG